MIPTGRANPSPFPKPSSLYSAPLIGRANRDPAGKGKTMCRVPAQPEGEEYRGEDEAKRQQLNNQHTLIRMHFSLDLLSL